MIKKFLILFCFCLFSFKSYAGFSLFPLAVDFENKNSKRSQTLEIINSSPELQTYRVSLIQLKQKADGAFEEVPAMDNAAKEFLSFSPRQFTLNPGEKQSVRVARKNISRLEDGEYVTHLQVREIEMPRPKENSKNKNEFSVSIKILQAVSIPVTIYKGETLEAKTEITSLKSSGNTVEVKLKRLGNISSRLKLEVLDKKGKTIGEADNVRIYIPNKTLTVSVSLKDVTQTPNTLVLKDGLSGKELSRHQITR